MNLKQSQRTHHLLISLFFVPSILLITSALFAFDQKDVCFAKEKQSAEKWVQDLNECEQNWTEYRAIQAKIRALYYEPLWKSRVDSSNPLDKELRASGLARESYYSDRIRELEKLSVDKANQILALIRKLGSRQNYFDEVSKDPVNQDCYEDALHPAQTILSDTLTSFSHIQETERDYHTAVKATAGRESGQYPEDTVERGGVHDDLYERFELERGAKRYEEDLAMMRFFEALRYFAAQNLLQSHCCLKPEASSYDQKIKTVHV